MCDCGAAVHRIGLCKECFRISYLKSYHTLRAGRFYRYPKAVIGVADDLWAGTSQPWHHHREDTRRLAGRIGRIVGEATTPLEVRRQQQEVRKSLRSRLRSAIKNGARSGSAVRDLGLPIPDFMSYIAAQFKPGMSWDNWGEWHLDHIRPLASFDLSHRTQLLEACNYRNYQPLWAADNLGKSHLWRSI